MLSGYGLLLVSCVVAAILLARGRLPKLEAVAIALFIVVVACVGTGGLLSTSLSHGRHADGRALMACAVGPLMALLLRTVMLHRLSGPALGAVSTVLLIFGLSAHAAALGEFESGPVLVAAAVALSAASATAALVATLGRARLAGSRLSVLRIRSEAASALALAVASALALVDLLLPQLSLKDAWAATMALSVAAFVAARLAPLPVSGRDITIVGAAAALAVLMMPHGGSPAHITATLAASVTLAAGVATGGLLALSVRFSRAPVPTPATTTAPMQDLSGLHSLAPILDDAIMRRPSRPRVLSRTSTRRLLEAAIDKAWRAQPHGRGRAPVDVSGSDEADIDGDASELAEALSLVFDNAFRHTAVNAQRLGVTVRSVAQTVSIELDDPSLPKTSTSSPPRPFLDGSADVDRPGYGTGLARARLLVERHGGQLSVRTLPQGTVHITLPRRVHRGPIGVA